MWIIDIVATLLEIFTLRLYRRERGRNSFIGSSVAQPSADRELASVGRTSSLVSSTNFHDIQPSDDKLDEPEGEVNWLRESLSMVQSSKSVSKHRA